MVLFTHDRAGRRKLFLVLAICLVVVVFAVWRFRNMYIKTQLDSRGDKAHELVLLGQHDEALSLYENLLAEYPEEAHFRGEIVTCCTYALEAIQSTTDSDAVEERSRWLQILIREGKKILRIATKSRTPKIETAAVSWILNVRWNMEKWRKVIDGIAAEGKSVAEKKAYETLKEQLSEIDGINQRFAQLQWAVEEADALESLGKAQIQQVSDKIEGSKENGETK